MWRGLQVENSRGIFLDGWYTSVPRSPWFRGEKKNCKNVIASKVWNCEVHKNYSPWPPPIPKLYKKRSGWRLRWRLGVQLIKPILVDYWYLLNICWNPKWYASLTLTLYEYKRYFEVTWQVSADMTRLAEYLALHCKLQNCTDIIIYTQTRILRTLNGLCWDWNTHEQNCK